MPFLSELFFSLGVNTLIHLIKRIVAVTSTMKTEINKTHMSEEHLGSSC